MSATDNVTGFPEMRKNEYEWLSHTAYGTGEGCTLYRHRMSSRPVLVFQKGEHHTIIWLPTTVVETIKQQF